MSILPTEQFSVFAGASGAGKTTLLLEAWREHELGHDFPLAFDPEAKSAGIVVADRTAAETVQRAKQLGITNLEIYGIVDDFTLSTQFIRSQSQELFHRVMKNFSDDHRVMFIDPIALFMNGKFVDYNNVAASMIEFNRYAKKHRKTMLGVHHTTKARSDVSFLRPQDRASGSGAIAGFTSSQLILIQGLESGKDYDTLTIIHHTSPLEEFKLVRREDGYFAILDQYAKSVIVERMRSRPAKIMRIEEFLAEGLKYNLELYEIENWLSNDPRLVMQGDYILLQE